MIAILGTLYFFARRQVPAGFRWPIFGHCPLLGLQGVIGIFMVWSGYNTAEDVSHYRLALHLGTAFFCLRIFLVDGFAYSRAPTAGPNAYAPLGLGLWRVGADNGIWAYTAGLNAGPISHTWPNFTADSFLPAQGQCSDFSRASLTYWLDSKWVHFVHRHVAMIAAGFVIFAALSTLRQQHTGRAGRQARLIAYAGIFFVLAQVALGIYLVVAGVPMAQPCCIRLGPWPADCRPDCPIFSPFFIADLMKREIKFLKNALAFLGMVLSAQPSAGE